jgi:hypothetical protein
MLAFGWTGGFSAAPGESRTNELNGFETGTTLRPHRSSVDPINRDSAEADTNQRKGAFTTYLPLPFRRGSCSISFAILPKKS